MPKEVNLVLSPELAAKTGQYILMAARQLRVSPEEITDIRVKRKSIDARKKDIKINLTLIIYLNGEKRVEEFNFDYRDVSNATPVIIVGSGPAGLFAALRLIELGYKPIIVERGKDVHARKIDIATINRNGEIDENSNYCYGEGGAGTFSDGKLFTRSKKRGNVSRTLHTLYNHGAEEEILYMSHPHIGTDKLPNIIENIRNTIKHYGGEVHFDTKVEDIIINNETIIGVITDKGDKIEAAATILATGHSAREMYEVLHNRGVELEAKNFAMGLRVEHPQRLIDSIQYSRGERGDYLPAAEYSLVAQIGGRGVYSFCMCPGGFIVPAGVRGGEAVVNGMSPSKRGSKYANSAIVTEIRESDYAHLIPQYGVLAGLKYQQEYEEASFLNGGGAQIVPAQRLTDFLKGKVSQNLGETSYIPGVTTSNMVEWMPGVIYKSLEGGFRNFGEKMRGFITKDAMVLGVESRTSSPVRIPRDKDGLHHVRIKNLYPAGEGAGYAGGIVSAALDGERVAEAVANSL